jgi:hypothetical protein
VHNYRGAFAKLDPSATERWSPPVYTKIDLSLSDHNKPQKTEAIRSHSVSCFIVQRQKKFKFNKAQRTSSIAKRVPSSEILLEAAQRERERDTSATHNAAKKKRERRKRHVLLPSALFARGSNSVANTVLYTDELFCFRVTFNLTVCVFQSPNATAK